MDKKHNLSRKHCIPCSGGVPSLKGEEIKKLHALLQEGWQVAGEHHLQREYRFKDFKEALDFTNLIGKIAEEENHHPDIILSYGKVTVQIWTHKVNGLTESDFILAAKIDAATKA